MLKSSDDYQANKLLKKNIRINLFRTVKTKTSVQHKRQSVQTINQLFHHVLFACGCYACSIKLTKILNLRDYRKL